MTSVLCIVTLHLLSWLSKKQQSPMISVSIFQGGLVQKQNQHLVKEAPIITVPQNITYTEMSRRLIYDFFFRFIPSVECI